MAKEIERNSFVKKSPRSLMLSGERDLININSNMKDTFMPEMEYPDTLVHAQQSVEKYLKSYIKNTGQDVKETHNLEKLYSICQKIDKSFINIEQNCIYLNKFTALLRYEDQDNLELEITSNTVKKAIKNLIEIREFGPIKDLRNHFSEDGNFLIISNINKIGTDNFGKAEYIDFIDLGENRFESLLNENCKILHSMDIVDYDNGKMSEGRKIKYSDSSGNILYALERNYENKDGKINYDCFIFNENFDPGIISKNINKSNDHTIINDINENRTTINT